MSDREGIDERLDALEARSDRVDRILLVTVGEDGTNGKLSRVAADVEGGKRAVRQVLAALVGSVAVVIGLLFNAGRHSGAQEEQVRNLERRVSQLEEQLRHVWRAKFGLEPTGD